MTSNNRRLADIFLRYILATIGLFLVAMGISLSAHSCFGIVPLSCPAFVLGQASSISFGQGVIITNIVLIFVQLAILRRRFQAKFLLQIITVLLLGYLVDFWELVFAGLYPATIAGKTILIVLASFASAFGISLELAADAWMLSVDLTIKAITIVRPQTKFWSIKIIIDSCFVAVAAIAGLLLWGNALGNCADSSIADTLLGKNPNAAIGIGTIILAFLPGYVMRFTDSPAKRITSKLLNLIQK